MNAYSSWRALKKRFYLKKRLFSGKESRIPTDCESKVIVPNKKNISEMVLGNIGYTSTTSEKRDVQKGSQTQSQVQQSNIREEIIDGTLYFKFTIYLYFTDLDPKKSDIDKIIDNIETSSRENKSNLITRNKTKNESSEIDSEGFQSKVGKSRQVYAPVSGGGAHLKF